MVSATLAEYPNRRALLAALASLREVGYRKVDSYTPYFDADLDRALHAPRSRLPYFIFAAGLSGAALAYGLEWLTVAYLYPLNTGGRPPHMPLAFFIITFEMGVLSAAVTAFVGVIVKARLLRLYDPIFEVDGIERSSTHRHWLRVDASDPLYDAESVRTHLESTRPIDVVDQPEAAR